ncbi:MAG: serine hydrolase [Verrucomicrobia bacterium]|nr:serine hydrolase [Verrucomicrobiota bacterium]MDA1065059.1 serine hydrolase [Verrucomicrobiota bacterium]
MKRREFLLSSVTGLLVGSARMTAQNNKTDSFAEACKLIQNQVDVGILESAVLHVNRGRNSQLRAFGKAQSGDAIFLIASITKPMTATGMMVLVDSGELKLSDKVVTFIPEFSEGDRKDITIQHLLTHTSGLPDQLPENDELRKRHAPLNDFVSRVVKTPLLFKPGTAYKYQSMGFLLAAEVAQRITNQPFATFLSKEVYEPLEMNRSALDLGPFKLSETVRNQTEFAAPESGSGSVEAKDWDWNSPYWRNLGAPWGGAHSTAQDITRFLGSFINPDGKVLKEATAYRMIQDHNRGLDKRRGLGFDLGTDSFGEHCSESTFGHGGSTGTLAWADPKTGTSCVILTSLPSRKSKSLILQPVSDLVSS